MTTPDLSVVIPVSTRRDDLGAIVTMIEEQVRGVVGSYEIVIVFDGTLSDLRDLVEKVATGRDDVRVLELARKFGEGAALRAGLQEAHADLVLTHPAYYQVEGSVIPDLIRGIQGSDDLAFAARTPPSDRFLNRVQRWVFNATLRKLLWVNYNDVACGVRAIRRDALERLSVHGSFHRFIPVLAAMEGLRVREIPVAQHAAAHRTRLYSPLVYVRRILDLLNIFFLLRFTYKPLRFFGLLGGVLLAVGGALLLYLCGVRLFTDQGIGDRPLLIVGVMCFSLGVQVFALGLLGELITFTHAAHARPYSIREHNVRTPEPGSARDEEKHEVASPANTDER